MGSLKKRRWLYAICGGGLALLIALLSVDQIQGGPLGRTYHSYDFGESMNTKVGQPILFGGDEVFNSTWFPFNILSVRPTHDIPGVSLKAGMLILKQNQSMPGVMLPDAHLYSLVREPVKIPVGSNIHSKQRYAIALVAIAEHSGSFSVDGLLISYAWGPFTYTAKFPAKFILVAR